VSRASWIVAVLLASGVALFAVEIGKGAFHGPSPKIANPCHERGGRTGGLDATIQRIVLDGLDGAACRLHTTREELVLSLGSGTGVHRRWDEHTVEVALRAGLLRSLDEAVQRGDVPAFLEPVLRRLVENAPLDKIVKGGFSLGDLLG
jgi:hypothetical protein